MPVVNDVQSQLNETSVERVEEPRTVDEVCAIVRRGRAEGRSLAVCGGRHAMGGQQFRSGDTLLDCRRLDRLLHLDRARRLVRVESGIMWPALIERLHAEQAGEAQALAIRQKQTGVDEVTIAGTIASRHRLGRGSATSVASLAQKPRL